MKINLTLTLLTGMILVLLLMASSSQAFVTLPFNWLYLGTGPTVTMYVNPNCVDPSAPDELAAQQNAMNTWTNCPANFNFNYGGPTSVTNWYYYNFQNDIFWSAEAGGGALASTNMWYSGSNMTQADIKFYDNGITWSTQTSPGFLQFDVESVALHELGHVVGLDHSQYSNAVMWYAINYMEVQRILDQDDISGIVSIYGTGGGQVLTVTMTATGSTTIPSSGGSIPYNVSLHNNTTSSLTFDAWTEYVNGMGQSQGLIVNRPDLTLGGGGTILRSLVLTIAGSVLNGTYTYYARTAFQYPGPIIDEDGFQFVKGGDDAEAPWVWETTSTGWDEPTVNLTPVLPEAFAVLGAFPNPFNPETSIRFDLPQAGQVKLSIYDLQGKRVVDLLEGSLEAGQYSASWNAAGYPSGTYLYRFSNEGNSQTGKLVLLK